MKLIHKSFSPMWKIFLIEHWEISEDLLLDDIKNKLKFS